MIISIFLNFSLHIFLNQPTQMTVWKISFIFWVNDFYQMTQKYHVYCGFKRPPYSTTHEQVHASFVRASGCEYKLLLLGSFFLYCRWCNMKALATCGPPNIELPTVTIRNKLLYKWPTPKHSFIEEKCSVIYLYLHILFCISKNHWLS